MLLFASIWGNSITLSPRSNALSNADIYGYVRIPHVLGEFEIQKGIQRAISIVFTSDPSIQSGAFGTGWRMPLFNSSIMQYRTYELVWYAPDERLYFFNRQNRGEKNQEESYQHLGNRWVATVKRNGDILITGKDVPQWLFQYEKGKLRRFRLGPNSYTFRVDYHIRGLPHRIVSETTNKIVFEIEYESSKPKSIKIGKRHIKVGMENKGPGYTNRSEWYLKSLSYDDDTEIRFDYTQEDRIAKEAYRIVPKSIEEKSKIRVNRLTVINGAAESCFVWGALSGFIIYRRKC
jgi:hypothetical protein